MKAAVFYAPALLVLDSLIYSATPLIPQFIGSMSNIWIAAWFLVGATIGKAAISVASLRGRLAHIWRERRTFLDERIALRDFYAIAISEWAIVGIILAAALAGPTITAVLSAMWPMWWMIMLQRHPTKTARTPFRRVGRGEWLAGVCGCIGCACTVVANPVLWGDNAVALVAGVATLLAVVCLDSLTALRLPWGFDSSRWANDSAPPTGWIMLGSALSGTICVPVMVAAAGLFGSRPGTFREIALCVAAGACIQAGGEWLVNSALVHTRSTALLSICLSQPVGTIMWGVAFGVLGDVAFPPLLAGAALVIGSGVWVVCRARPPVEASTTSPTEFLIEG